MAIPKLVEDAAYVSVGFAVLAVQQAQVRRRDLERQLAALAQVVEERGDDPEQPLARTLATLLATAGSVLASRPAADPAGGDRG